MRLDGSKGTEPVKQGQTVLYADLKVRILPTLQWHNKGRKTNIHKISMNVICIVSAVLKDFF